MSRGLFPNPYRYYTTYFEMFQIFFNVTGSAIPKVIVTALKLNLPKLENNTFTDIQCRRKFLCSRPDTTGQEDNGTFCSTQGEGSGSLLIIVSGIFANWYFSKRYESVLCLRCWRYARLSSDSYFSYSFSLKGALCFVCDREIYHTINSTIQSIEW